MQVRLEPFGARPHILSVNMDEAELIDGLRQRDTAAVGQLLDRFGDRLLRSAYVLCGNETEAQDLAQETLLQAVQSVDRFRGQSALYTWLHGILLNVSRSQYRKQRRLVYVAAVPETETLGTDATAGSDMATAAGALLAALHQLSPEHREVIVLRYYEDLPIEEIARRCGARKGTVKSRLHYATGRLRELLPAQLNPFAAANTYSLES